MKTDVVVIGAGPSGSIVGALLQKRGVKCLVLEKEDFPRFVIGESLLPFCMHALEEAGFLDAVLKNQKKLGFQFKNGVAFSRGEEKVDYRYFDFCDKSSSGYDWTFQVRRADFDKLLIDEAINQGVEVRFGKQVKGFDWQKDNQGYVSVVLDGGEVIKSRFIIDASGYGRVLPRALGIETPSTLPPRMAIFTHIQDEIQNLLYDRRKILVCTHPVFEDVWFWLIPFSDGRASIGVVGDEQRILGGRCAESEEEKLEILKSLVYRVPMFRTLLDRTKWDSPARDMKGYSSNVQSLYGENYALLGNAGEFLDPVFSSGVTIAMHSATLLAPLVARIIQGEEVDLEKEYEKPLYVGIDAFRTYVMGWYDGRFQEVIHVPRENHTIKRQICSILAGFAWDDKNPYSYKSQQALQALYEICISEKQNS